MILGALVVGSSFLASPHPPALLLDGCRHADRHRAVSRNPHPLLYFTLAPGARLDLRRYSTRMKAVPFDCYAVLEISENATEQEIKRAYRRAATMYHPDVNKDPGSAKKFADICDAYAALKDPKSREAHDRARRRGSSSTSSSSSSSSSSSRGRASSSSSTASSSSSSSRSTSGPSRDEEGDFGAGGDSFGAIFSDLFGAVARSTVGAAARAQAGRGGGGGGGSGLLEDLLSFLEASVGGPGAESSAELDDLLRSGTKDEV